MLVVGSKKGVVVDSVQNKLTIRPSDHTFSVHHPEARGRAEGSGYRREYRDGDVQNLLPEFVLVHSFEFSF